MGIVALMGLMKQPRESRGKQRSKDYYRVLNIENWSRQHGRYERVQWLSMTKCGWHEISVLTALKFHCLEFHSIACGIRHQAHRSRLSFTDSYGQWLPQFMLHLHQPSSLLFFLEYYDLCSASCWHLDQQLLPFCWQNCWWNALLGLPSENHTGSTIVSPLS